MNELKPMPPGSPTEVKIDVESIRNLTHERNALRAERDDLQSTLYLVLEVHPTRNTREEYVEAVRAIVTDALTRYEEKSNP